MTIQSLYPSIAPSLNLDFANTKTLDPRVTFTRASTATFYDGRTFAKAEENLLLQSQTMSTSPWTVVNAASAGSKTAPDGTVTAIEIAATTTNGRTQQSVTVVSGQTYTLSMFVRRVTGTGNVNLIIADSAGTSLFTTTMSLTSDWQRFTVSGAPAVTSISCRIVVATSGDVVEVWGAQLEQRSTVTAYTPTTTQPITNYIPVLQTAAVNTPRFDHNPVTGESLGLLIEEQRTNLLTYSEQFDNAAWTKTRSSITANTIVAPDGTLTGDKLVEDTTASSTHFAAQNVSVTSGTSYTFSFYAKRAERQFVQPILLSAGFGANTGPIVDLSNGTIANVGVGTYTSTITAVGNGWYRIAVTAAATATASTQFQIRTSEASSTSLYTGDGTSGIYIWGAQLEVGAFPTSYIPTVASQVTRSADVAVMTGANFSSWYRQDEGTVFAEANTSERTPTNKRIWAISASSTANSISAHFGAASGGVLTSIINTNGVFQYGSSEGAYVGGVYYKRASAFVNGDPRTATNGVLASTAGASTTVVPTGLNRFDIGNRLGIESLNGHIRRIAYYPQRLPNAQLQALTT